MSTRELADLAGTTVKAVRHYHDIGLLDLPERSSNGYKQYTVTHLVRLLQIKRLRDLGVALSDIPALNGVVDEDVEQLIRQLDADIATSIERLNQVRSELHDILRDHVPIDVPVEFGPLARGISESDRALIMVYSRILSEEQLNDLRNMLQWRHPLSDEFDLLPPDADDDAIEDLAERFVPGIRRQMGDYPWMNRAMGFGPLGEDDQSLIGEAMLALYNPAQRSVSRRIRVLVQQQIADESRRQLAEDGDLGTF